MAYIIYADIKSFFKKRDGCTKNPEHSSTTKIGELILPCGYSLSTIFTVNYVGF